MRRNVFSIVLVAAVLALFVAVNVLFVSRPREVEDEQTGDRSSDRATKFGTLAYYTLLSERGYSVERLTEPYTSLASSDVSTLFVVVPKSDAQPTEEELTALDSWVEGGGNLVVVDREIRLEGKMGSFETGLPHNGAPRAATPSSYTRGVADLRVTPYATTISEKSGDSTVQFATESGAIMLDKPVGAGHVTMLTEPYVIQNNGIDEGDNVALALNLADGVERGGTVAFDEYHHGANNKTSESSRGGLRDYIANTPVPWIVGQLGLLALVAAVTIGSRFGRATPVRTARRTSALEFVSSMAGIQRLARASDLAIENVYTSFRARLCRYANVPSDTKPADLARAAASRGEIEPNRVRAVIQQCEDAISQRKQMTADELLAVVREVRAIEAELRI